MMNKPGGQSGSLKRSLFLRLWMRSLTVKRPQAALAFGAIVVGAALAAALLNLHGGVRRKMTQEFRAYGANVIVSARADASGTSQPGLVGDEILAGLTDWKNRNPGALLAPMLHVVMRLRPAKIDARLPEFQNVVVVGSDFQSMRALYPNWRWTSVESQHAAALPQDSSVGARGVVPMPTVDCVAGTRVGAQLHLVTGSEISIEPVEASAWSAGAQHAAPPQLRCRISAILSTGAAEDDRVFVPLSALQQASELEGKQSLMELLIPGDAAEIERAVAELGRLFPTVSIRPVRAIVESQGRVLGTIRWLLVALTALILLIVALCVMATMTAIVLERKKDVAIMKALGATDRLIMRLFLCEGAGLGLAGGVAGFGLGLLLARELGLKLFGVPLSPTWWTLPFIGFGSVLVAVLATAFPVRMARAVRPATTLKGV